MSVMFVKPPGMAAEWEKSALWRSAAQIPGPMLRMPEGTTVHVTVTNKLKMKATVYGLNTRPCNAAAGLEILAGESHEFTFAAGTPGT